MRIFGRDFFLQRHKKYRGVAGIPVFASSLNTVNGEAPVITDQRHFYRFCVHLLTGAEVLSTSFIYC